MTSESRAKEIAKGAGKGLVGTIMTAMTLGFALPVVDRIYSSVQTKEGRIAYGASSAALLASGFAYLIA